MPLFMKKKRRRGEGHQGLVGSGKVKKRLKNSEGDAGNQNEGKEGEKE